MKKIRNVLFFCVLSISIYGFENGPPPPNPSTGLNSDDDKKCAVKRKNQLKKCNDRKIVVPIKVWEPYDRPCGHASFVNFCDPQDPYPGNPGGWATSQRDWNEDLEFFGFVSTDVSCCKGYGTYAQEWSKKYVSGCTTHVFAHSRYYSKLSMFFYTPCDECNGNSAFYRMPAGGSFIAPGANHNISVTPRFAFLNSNIC